MSFSDGPIHASTANIQTSSAQQDSLQLQVANLTSLVKELRTTMARMESQLTQVANQHTQSVEKVQVSAEKLGIAGNIEDDRQNPLTIDALHDQSPLDTSLVEYDFTQDSIPAAARNRTEIELSAEFPGNNCAAVPLSTNPPINTVNRAAMNAATATATCTASAPNHSPPYSNPATANPADHAAATVIPAAHSAANSATTVNPAISSTPATILNANARNVITAAASDSALREDVTPVGMITAVAPFLGADNFQTDKEKNAIDVLADYNIASVRKSAASAELLADEMMIVEDMLTGTSNRLAVDDAMATAQEVVRGKSVANMRSPNAETTSAPLGNVGANIIIPTTLSIPGDEGSILEDTLPANAISMPSRRQDSIRSSAEKYQGNQQELRKGIASRGRRWSESGATEARPFTDGLKR